MSLWARDEAGNAAPASLDSKVTPKQFRKSTIPLDDAFLQKVVPAILQNTPDLAVKDPSDLLASYLRDQPRPAQAEQRDDPRHRPHEDAPARSSGAGRSAR